ncbi:MAG: hypothetical protein N2319_06785 [Candidatus Kapabacteria bacterium]|nr:hypothetical protein [Candidatus Kapabacteria bacterium]
MGSRSEQEAKNLETRAKIQDEIRKQNILDMETETAKKREKYYETIAKLPKHLCISLSPSVSWNYGVIESKLSKFEINSFNVDFGLGYWIDLPLNEDLGTLFSLFISVGTNNFSAVKNIFEEQNLDISNLNNSIFNKYLNFEFGGLINQWFRISAGFGMQEYNNKSNEINKLRYFCSTIGINIPFTKVWDLGLKSVLLFGRDFNKISATFSLSSSFYLNFGRW